ncbi:MAG: hypothetical protein K2Q03_05720 [Sphingobacteriaceae bacterium]|nr:hypothetical protein [Sphingobacteriaceae bacterium]
MTAELEEQLFRTMQKIANSSEMELITGIVKSVDKTKRSIVLQRDGFEDIVVQLNATEIKESEQTLFPKQGSAVLVAMPDRCLNGYVVLCSEVESLHWKFDKYELDVNADGFSLKNDKDDLLSLVMELIGFVKKIIVVQGTGPDVAGLSQLETKFKGLLKK